jgi:glycosyltransferase involved in cell wall biosynthesis
VEKNSIVTAAPLVSIVVNNYNYGHFLAVAIQSALNQTYHQIEVIVVDDGSTDDSRDVIRRFGQRVTSILKENEGQASTFNAGFEASHGECVVFLDADDLLLPDAVSTAVGLLRDNHVVKVHWNLWEIDDLGRRTGKLHKKSLVEGDLRDEFIQSGPISLTQSPTSGNAWARWFLEKVMPLPEHEDKHGADGFLKKLCPIFGEIRRTLQPLGCYRIHSASYGGGKDLLFKLRRGLTRHPTYCQLLAHHLRRMGVHVDPATWMGPDSHYRWLQNAVALCDEFGESVPRDEPFILLDNDALGQEFFAGYDYLPFLEHDGEYWGQPTDDRQAIRELNRMRSNGAAFLAIAFPAFWWAHVYVKFFEYVRSNFDCLCDNERLMVFDLRRQRPISVGMARQVTVARPEGLTSSP